jgi:tetratricopeptide (TPR) repeat protein
MYSKAFAPEYQGALGSLSVNSSLADVLAKATEQLRAATDAGHTEEAARSGLAVAEAHRRLGHNEAADRAWKASYRAARSVGDLGAMAWAAWSGGTLARQRGALPLAYRLLALAADLAERGGDNLARGYSLAGMAETGRIQGDYQAVRELHEQLLAEARERGETRHTVWALEGIAQMHRNSGSYHTALEMFEEAERIAEQGDDRRGRAWALRGMADVLSVRDGDTERALTLLGEGEAICREMNLSSALAYQHKMRANVLFRAGRYAEARPHYETALDEFRAIGELRGSALARLGLLKTLARLGADPMDTQAELARLRESLAGTGLDHVRRLIDNAREEPAATMPRPAPRASTPVSTLAAAPTPAPMAVSGGGLGS